MSRTMDQAEADTTIANAETWLGVLVDAAKRTVEVEQWLRDSREQVRGLKEELAAVGKLKNELLVDKSALLASLEQVTAELKAVRYMQTNTFASAMPGRVAEAIKNRPFPICGNCVYHFGADCRRHAPRVVESDMASMPIWPKTELNDSCGDFSMDPAKA